VSKAARLVLWVAVTLGALIGLARLVAVRWWRVPDDPYLAASVTPTLRGGDWVLLWRLSRPSFGALAVCPEPGHPERWVIGRLLGEPGDAVKVEGSRVTVNDKPSELEHSCPRFVVNDPSTGADVDQDCQVETLGGASYQRGGTGRTEESPPQEFRVDPGTVFLVSDNRLFPYDSRDFGAVPWKSCAELVFFRLVGKEGYFDTQTRFTYIR
jgi:signal peptidase I